MKNLLAPILAVFAVFTMSLAVTSPAIAQEVTEKSAKDKVEVKKPSLTYYYIDR